MLNMKTIDAKALKILLKYNVYAEGLVARGHPLSAKDKEYVEAHCITPENMAYLKQHGLAFDSIMLSHDEAVKMCFEYYALCKKRHVTDAFLASLGSARLDYRSGLSAYAIMQTMPDHAYQQTPASNCNICCAQESEKRVDLTALNRQRFGFGSMIAFKNPYQIQFFLQQQARLEDIIPTSSDYAIFNAIIDMIINAVADAKPNDMVKKLRTVAGFKASVDQCKYLLEILGFCSILENEKYKGYLAAYTNPGLAPSKSHSSNWAYPVDFWTGKDGINRDAFDFWFGDYKEIVIPKR